MEAFAGRGRLGADQRRGRGPHVHVEHHLVSLSLEKEVLNRRVRTGGLPPGYIDQ